jgi:hypothetical protein
MSELDTSGTRNIDTRDGMRALVIRNDDPTLQGRIGVLIPKLMPFEEPNMYKEVVREEDVETSCIINEEIHGLISKNVTRQNYIWASPERSITNNYRVPYVGTTVFVYMEDGDPQKLYYRQVRPTLDGERPRMKQVKAAPQTLDAKKKPWIHLIEEFQDGTTIYYNEDKDNREYEVKFSNGYALSIADNKNESAITLKTSSGHSMVMDTKGKAIKVKSSGGHSITMDDNGGKIDVIGSGGGKVIIKGSNVMIN